MGIELLSPNNAADIGEVAVLHETQLGDSPVVLLGSRFLREFFYPKLVQDGLLECLICRADGRIVAFLSWTKYPHDFMMRGIRGHFIQLCWIMLRQIAGQWSSIHSILAALRLVRERSGGSKRPDAATGEAVSLVVVPEFQKHVPPGGKGRLTVRLFEDMARHLRDDGMERVTFLVKPENRASNIFFSAAGCDFEKVTCAGLQVHQYTYHLNGRPKAAASVRD